MKTLTKPVINRPAYAKQTMKKHPCMICDADSVSYFVPPVWIYPANFEGELPLYWYCAKHQQEVLEKIPANLREAVRVSFTITGRHLKYPDTRNELLLHDGYDVAIGAVARKLKADKHWPRKEDEARILDMTSKNFESVFLIFDVNGKFKAKFNNYYEASNYQDVATECLVYWVGE